jgi:aspartyl-tRNA(Asn)/glutamyl-tRNA(Gln) amidotransferase subunit A
MLVGIERGAKGLRVGVPRDHVWAEVVPEIASSVRAAIDSLATAGAEVRELSWTRAAEYANAAGVILRAEMLAVHARWFPSRAAEYGEPVRERIAASRPVAAEEYANAMRLLVDARAGLADADLEGVDVLAMPSVPYRSWTIEEAKQTRAAHEWTRITRIFDLTGQPAISVPCGLDSGGVPIGLQLAGRMWDEPTVLRAARAYEQIRGPFPPPAL